MKKGEAFRTNVLITKELHKLLKEEAVEKQGGNLSLLLRIILSKRYKVKTKPHMELK